MLRYGQISERTVLSIDQRLVCLTTLHSRSFWDARESSDLEEGRSTNLKTYLRLVRDVVTSDGEPYSPLVF